MDPRDPNHMYLGLSGGGFFESTDAGADWKPLNSGVAMDFAPSLPDGAEYPHGHDPHCVQFAPSNPDRLWRQDHCGLYRMDRATPAGIPARWVRVGDAMPKEVGDIGFPIAAHPTDADTAWVFPMDGTSVWPRTSPGGKPAVYCTRDAGISWRRLDSGLPTEQAWWTVKRQCLAAGAGPKGTVGVYFGTTSGEVWGSRNGTKKSARFRRIASNLPHIYAVAVLT